jgi:hypothetical protein
MTPTPIPLSHLISKQIKIYTIPINPDMDIHPTGKLELLPHAENPTLLGAYDTQGHYIGSINKDTTDHIWLLSSHTNPNS